MIKIMILNKKIFIFQLSIFLLNFLVILFFGFSANALEITYPQMLGTDKTPDQCLELASELQLGCFVKYIYSVALTSSGIICFAVVLFGGVLYLISGTSITKVKLAKAKIYGAFLGISFLLVSYLILNLVNPQLLILSAKRPLSRCPYDFQCPEGMICQDGMCVSSEPLPAIEKPGFIYVEVPLAWLIERVTTRTQIVEAQAIVVNDFVAEQDTPGHATIKELSECLKKLIPLCKCSTLEGICHLTSTQACNKWCEGDPCGETIARDKCSKYDIPDLETTHLRTAMNNIAQAIKDADSKIDTQKDVLEKVTAALKKEKQKLELAEYLMTHAKAPPTSLHDIADILTEPPKILQVWQEMDPAGIGVLPQKRHNDPSHFYVSEQANKDLINIINSVVFSSANLPLPPGWNPPDPPPLPTDDPEAVILDDIPGFFQMDDKWAVTQINGCNDKIGVKSPPCEAITGCGCGPTSLAMILSYFFDPDIEPGTIANNLTKNEYVCGMGSAINGLAQWAYDNYVLNVEKIGFNELQTNIRNGKPVMAGCSHFGKGYGMDWGHISVIKGVEQGHVYFQDPVVDEIVFSEQAVNNFSCHSFFAFSKP